MKTLNPLEFQILAVLGTSPMAGRAIAVEYEKEFGRISYGTLYTTLRRLGEAGLVDAAESSDADGRIRNFTLTGNGRIALQRSRAFYRNLSQFGLPARQAT